MARSFSGKTGVITMPSDEEHRIVDWVITVTGGMRKWSGSFVAPPATIIATTTATGFIGIDFADETGDRWTGAINLAPHFVTGRPQRLPFTSASTLERNGEEFC